MELRSQEILIISELTYTVAFAKTRIGVGVLKNIWAITVRCSAAAPTTRCA